MTPEQFTEIKRRHADDARTHANTGQVSNGFADRDILIAEVEWLQGRLQSVMAGRRSTEGLRRRSNGLHAT